ncbi:DUF6129 family protein [Bradyrhizobium sp.]|uniref:DUF6129 family protein n=1 Tax=Bradyrhizobium sp. TaxID=376 RepID=UPI003C5DC984
MALGTDELTEIEILLSAESAEADPFAVLRGRFPHLSWTRCDASDVTETPFRTYQGFDLHLVDKADHCVKITNDPAYATGIILAAKGTV